MFGRAMKFSHPSKSATQTNLRSKIKMARDVVTQRTSSKQYNAKKRQKHTNCDQHATIECASNKNQGFLSNKSFELCYALNNTSQKICLSISFIFWLSPFPCVSSRCINFWSNDAIKHRYCGKHIKKTKVRFCRIQFSTRGRTYCTHCCCNGISITNFPFLNNTGTKIVLLLCLQLKAHRPPRMNDNFLKFCSLFQRTVYVKFFSINFNSISF